MSQAITQSVSTNIKLQLKKKVEACSSVDRVYGYEEPSPAGYPAVFITAADMNGEFSSNAENSRIYSYNLLVLFTLGENKLPESTINRDEYAEQVVSTVIDEIVNTMDTDFVLPDSDPTVLFVNAADCNWGTYESELGLVKAAQINLRVYTELTIR